MDIIRIRKILNIVFLIGAVASILCYYSIEDRHIFIYVCSASIFVKLVEFLLRFLCSTIKESHQEYRQYHQTGESGLQETYTDE